MEITVLYSKLTRFKRESKILMTVNIVSLSQSLFYLIFGLIGAKDKSTIQLSATFGAFIRTKTCYKKTTKKLAAVQELFQNISKFKQEIFFYMACLH